MLPISKCWRPCVGIAYTFIVWHNMTSWSTNMLQSYIPNQGRIQGGGGGGGLWGLKPLPFIFRLYLINMLSIIMKFCLSIIT